jgi:hypothetical protein
MSRGNYFFPLIGKKQFNSRESLAKAQPLRGGCCYCLHGFPRPLTCSSRSFKKSPCPHGVGKA